MRKLLRPYVPARMKRTIVVVVVVAAAVVICNEICHTVL
jgi:hypothetical protein